MPVFRTSDYLWRAPLKFGSGAWDAVVPSPPPPPPPPPPPAVTLTLSGPSSGATGVAASFSVNPSGPLVAAITVPLDATNGAALSVPTLTFASGATAAQSFTVTRATDGTSSVSMTNDGGLTNIGTPISFVSSSAAEYRYGTLAGQSNKNNMFGQNAHWPSGDIRATAYINGAERRIGNIADSYPAGTPTDTLPGGSYTSGDPLVDGDAIVFLGNRLAAQRGGPIMLHAAAIGGTTISTWLTGGSSWTPYAAGVTASGKVPTWATWLQGESDAGGNLTTYAANLVTLQSQFVSQSGLTAAAFGFAVIPLGPCTTAWRAEGTFGPMRQVQMTHASTSTGAHLLNCALDASLAGGDSVHWTVSSYIRQAKRIAEWVSRWAAGNADSMAGPRITGATRVGAVITVAVAHAGGSTLADGAGGAGAALAGFRVYDGGVLATISATAITSATTITLTLAATPAGAVTLDYAMANQPFGATAPAASTIVYDNTSVAGDTLGIPMQPKTLFTVT